MLNTVQKQLYDFIHWFEKIYHIGNLLSDALASLSQLSILVARLVTLATSPLTAIGCSDL